MAIKQLNKIIDIDKFIMCAAHTHTLGERPLNTHSFSILARSLWQVNNLKPMLKTLRHSIHYRQLANSVGMGVDVLLLFFIE